MRACLSAASFSNVSYCVSTGQSSSVAKLKSLTGAIEIMTETRHAFQLIHNELLEEQIKVWVADGKALLCLFTLSKLCSVSWSHTVTYTIFILSLPVLQLSESEPAESAESTDVATGPTSGLNLQEVMKLIAVFEPSFSFLLLQLIKLMTTVKRKPRWGRIKKAQWHNSRVYVSNILVIFTMLTPEQLPVLLQQ